MRKEIEVAPRRPDSQVTVHTSLLFDSKHKKLVSETSIVIDTQTGLITKVFKREKQLPSHNISSSNTIDLRGLTVLPGLVDAHTHIFLHSYSETPSINQERDESFIERIVRATNHAKSALDAGYTTYRDLGTEGLRDADVHFRDTINRGIIPGPRMFVATECITSSGGYEIRQENGMPGGTTVPRLSDAAEGVDGVRAAVRRRLGAGADIVKFYADYRKRQLRFPPAAWPGAKEIMFPPSGNFFSGDRNPSLLQFTQEEMNEMVAEAKRGKAPIAAHALSPEGVIMAAKAGVTSVEHGLAYDGHKPSEEALQALKENGTIFVPTLSVFDAELHRGGGDKDAERDLKVVLDHAKAAFDKGVKLATGGDTGAIAHGENAREIELMVEAGIPILDVLQNATLHGWDSCGGDLCGRKFGLVEEGWAADLIALDGNPTEDIGAIRKVKFVMKDGKVYK
ncbi:uncharacterized protein LY89DRAFT_683801 [Mollisia scopiformis]|uniref:Amidohydrolase-related domain-containing protein n=1 Tax=Mollisia scopiformis TaxID=149040 RepID=A0A194XFR5_MOLSC|nr:uncharacterized protein LY89DRAFT_683801 [Mollisia scopiformis]KUJ18986.1 hypothetical protein LY89DRAFT_683801 [Mollisia scopiformis]